MVFSFCLDLIALSCPPQNNFKIFLILRSGHLNGGDQLTVLVPADDN